MKTSRRGATIRYLMVVPAISTTLDDPAYGGDDAKYACNPMTATKDPDRLNYARGSGTTMDVVGSLIRIWVRSQNYLGMPRILKTDNQGVDRSGGDANRTCKQRRAGAIHRKRSRYLATCLGPGTAAMGIELTIIHCLFLCGSAVSRREGGVNDGIDRLSYSHCKWV